MRKTKEIQVGDKTIGGNAPITVQSMTNTKTADIEGTVNQIHRLTDVGCDIVRCAVPDMESANALAEIKKQISIPLVADIHYDPRLALASIKSGVDKIRINPGNIGTRFDMEKIAHSAGNAGIPIRIGINGGSLEKDILEKYSGVTPDALVESAVKNINYMESFRFDDLVVSIKTSDVRINYEAHKLLSTMTEYPLHIGITEAGMGQTAIIKSAIGIGALLINDIGDTMRVSLTGDPINEIKAAKDILSVLGLRKGSIDVISCPTCGRTGIDLEGLVAKVKDGLKNIEEDRIKKGNPSISVAVMGCSVNGPGEAGSADYGVACGREKGVIFQKGKIVKTVDEQNIVMELFDVIKKNEI